MNKILLAAVLAAGAVPAIAAAQVGVSVSVGQPGFFGEINIGDVQQQPPQVVYAQPVIAQPPPAVAVAVGPPPPPMYLHVPPGYERHWARHCAMYNACGRPVYFVKDDWYNRVYVPHYHQMHPEGMVRHEEAIHHEEAMIHHEHVEERAYDHEHDH
jgi:hypothetical protein